MSAYDFMMLSKIEQLQAISDKGKFITVKSGLGNYYELYSLGLFFIEIEKEFFTNKILKFSIFSSGTKLDKYAGEINIY